MRVIGLMSGTSYDAIDAAVADFSIQGDVIRLTPGGAAHYPLPDTLGPPPMPMLSDSYNCHCEGVGVTVTFTTLPSLPVLLNVFLILLSIPLVRIQQNQRKRRIIVVPAN